MDEFNYQLTNWVDDIEEILFAIKQLEEYGDVRDIDYKIKRYGSKVAVWTKGQRMIKTPSKVFLKELAKKRKGKRGYFPKIEV